MGILNTVHYKSIRTPSFRPDLKFLFAEIKWPESSLSCHVVLRQRPQDLYIGSNGFKQTGRNA